MYRLRLAGIAFLILCLTASVPAAAYAQDESGAKTALLVIDVQEFYFPGGAMPLDRPESAARNCGKLIEKFRSDGRLIVHVAHKASKGAGFDANVTPRDGEKVIVKDEVNAFNGTDLLAYLRDNGIDRLVICGMQTHMCVEAAVRAAHDLGFECVLIRDACATRALEFGGRTIGAEDVHDSTLSALDGTYAAVIDTKTFIETN
ncbi:MAG: cysteine hydrolase family protein [bacterium]